MEKDSSKKENEDTTKKDAEPTWRKYGDSDLPPMIRIIMNGGKFI